MSILEFHRAGGMAYMSPISIAFITNACLVMYVVYLKIKKQSVSVVLIETVKHISAFALAWGAFGTLTGLFIAFDALEAMKEVIPFQVMMGGLKVAILTILYGLLTFCIFMLAYIILKLTNKVTTA